MFGGDVYTGSLHSESLGLSGDLSMPKDSPFGVQSERLKTTFLCVKLHKRIEMNSKYVGVKWGRRDTHKIFVKK